MNKQFFISTAIPYVNAKPHLGFALEIVQADVVARYHRLKGEDVFFLTGTDENALKNVLAAKDEGVDVNDLVDKNSKEFKKLKETLNLSWDDFIRTTEDRHIKGVQKFWQACQKDIYKKKYKGLYCIGCEEFKTAKELDSGYCPEHPGVKLDTIEEENYFFRLSTYEDRLKKLIESGELKIIPETRKNEMLSFIKQGLHDFSISRSKERSQNWGIPVPGDDNQVIYVWFDALTNYINALGYADDSDKFQEYWQNNDYILHVIGKGTSRFHAIYWPAMLISAGLSLPKQVFIHGYLMIDGKKISKSLGNIILPSELVEKYGADSIRYYLLREIPSFEDGDFSRQKFEYRYNGDLANGLGNFTARVLTLADKLKEAKLPKDIESSVIEKIEKTKKETDKRIEEFKFHEALATIWELVSFGDKYINKHKPWETNDTEVILTAVFILDNIAILIKPFLPETSDKIVQSINWKNNKLEIKKGKILFPRINEVQPR